MTTRHRAPRDHLTARTSSQRRAAPVPPPPPRWVAFASLMMNTARAVMELWRLIS